MSPEPPSTDTELETPAYIEQYGLDTDPFSAAADHGAFCEDADVRQRLHLLLHLAQSSDLVLLVIGEAGSGKSALMHQLVRRLDEHWHACTVHGAHANTPGQVLARMAACCNLPTDCGEQALQVLLAEHAGRLAEQSVIPLIAIDDADHLAPDALDRVLGLAQAPAGTSATWHLVLAAKPQSEAAIRERAASALPGQELHRVTPVAFSEAQTLAYLRHRMRAAGLRGEVPFSEEQIRHLHRQSGGLPGPLNRMASQALLHTGGPAPGAAPGEAPPPGETAPGRRRRGLAAGLAALLALALGAALYFQEPINALFKPGAAPVPAGPSAETEQAPLPLPGAALPESPPQGGPGEPLKEADGTRRGPLWARRGPSEPAPVTPPTTSEPGPKATEGRGVEPQPPASVGPLPPAAEGPPVVETPVVPAPPAPEPAAQTEPQPAAPPNRAAAARELPALVRDRQWVLAQDPGRFTLQLLGSRSRDTVLQTARAHGLGGRAAVYRVRYEGRDWFVLVYGSFDGREAARQAVRELPEGLRHGGPWARPFGDVQAEVRAGHK